MSLTWCYFDCTYGCPPGILTLCDISYSFSDGLMGDTPITFSFTQTQPACGTSGVVAVGTFSDTDPENTYTLDIVPEAIYSATNSAPPPSVTIVNQTMNTMTINVTQFPESTTTYHLGVNSSNSYDLDNTFS